MTTPSAEHPLSAQRCSGTLGEMTALAAAGDVEGARILHAAIGALLGRP